MKKIFVSILLHHGAPVNCTDKSGFTPLFWATRSSSMSNIIELVDHGADVNFVATNDNLELDCHVFRTTPLFHARTYDTIKLLLSFGADPAHKASKNIIKTEQANNVPNIVQPKGVLKQTTSMLHFYEGNVKEESNQNGVAINLDDIHVINENPLSNGHDTVDFRQEAENTEVQCTICGNEYPESQIESHLVGVHHVDGTKEMNTNIKQSVSGTKVQYVEGEC